MANSIPLKSDSGKIYTHICGVCEKLSPFSYPSGGPTEKYLASSKEFADRCCICRLCGKVVEIPGKFHCNECTPAWEEQQKKIQEEITAKNIAQETRTEESLKLSKNRDKALALRDLMSKISEDYYCAGWLSGLEQTLWGILTGDTDSQFGFGKLLDYEIEMLRKLSEECGGWWRYDDLGEVFVPSEQWKEDYKAQRA